MYQHIFTVTVLAHLLLNSSLFYFLFDVFSDIVFWETALKSNYIHVAEIIKAKGVYRVPLY